MAEQILEKRCSRCGETKPADLAHFPWNKRKEKWNSWCRACYRRKSNLYNALHPRGRSPERRRVAEAERQWRIAQCEASKLLRAQNKLRAQMAAKERNKEHARRHNNKLKREAMEQYGGAFCQCCGETELSMLALDHVENNGASHRKSLTGKTRSMPTVSYIWAKRNNWPPIFQVSCFNCNWARHWNNGVCPHESRRQELTVINPPPCEAAVLRPRLTQAQAA